MSARRGRGCAVSDRHDFSVNEDELNRFWNDLAAGRPPSDQYDLSVDDVRLLSDFHARGTMPQSSSARERAQLKARTRIAAFQTEKEQYMSATIVKPAD